MSSSGTTIGGPLLDETLPTGGPSAVVRLKGVCYDVGREMLGQNWRPEYDLVAVGRDLRIIRDELHCNAIRLQGRSPERLNDAAKLALELGLEVWFSPELWDHSPDETVDYLTGASEVAQRLLDEFPGKVVLSVGSELTLFGQGFIPGENVLERLAHPKLREVIFDPSTRSAFRAFIDRLAHAARGRFRGKITYAAVVFEQPDWAPFDYVGVDLYRGDPMFDRYTELLQRYSTLGKPLVNTEFGCCTFRGADRWGGRGWEVVDWNHWPPRLRGNYIYDPSAQANELTALLTLNEAAGVYGTFVFTFVETGVGVPAGTDPTARPKLDFDPDLPRYALVRSFYPERHQGTTFPDVTWEPKESFYAVANYYRDH